MGILDVDEHGGFHFGYTLTLFLLCLIVFISSIALMDFNQWLIISL